MIFKMYNGYSVDLSHYNLPIRKINYLDDKIKDNFTGIEITNSVTYRFVKEGMIHRVGAPAVVSFGTGGYINLKWYEYGVLSNPTGPAVIRYLPPTEYGWRTESLWYLDGERYDYNFNEHNWTLFVKYIRQGMAEQAALDKAWELYRKPLDTDGGYFYDTLTGKNVNFTGFASFKKKKLTTERLYVNGKTDGTWHPAEEEFGFERPMLRYFLKGKCSCEFGPAIDYEHYWFNGVNYDFDNSFEGSSFIWYNTVQEMKAGKKFTETQYYLAKTKQLDEMNEQKRRQYAETYPSSSDRRLESAEKFFKEMDESRKRKRDNDWSM